MPVIPQLASIVRTRFDARAIAMSRIAVGLACVGQGLITWRMLLQIGGPDVARAPVIPGLPDIATALIAPYVILWMVAAVSFLTGFLTPVTGTALFAVIAYQLALDLNLYSNHTYLLMLSVGLLTLARSGSAMSLDSILFRRERSFDVAYAPVFLIAFQVSVMYSFTAIQKINPGFLAGSVLQRSLIFGNLIPGPVLPVLAVVVILIELFLAAALWMKELRSWAFFVGFGLHAVIPVLLVPVYLRDLIVFSTATLGLYFAFVPKYPARLEVVWDDYCSFCAGWIRTFRAFDWLHRLHFTGSNDAAAREQWNLTREETDLEIKVISRGAVLGGYDAVVEVLHCLPVSMFWAAPLGTPLARAMGRRAYRWAAARRKCTYSPRPAKIVSAGTKSDN